MRQALVLTALLSAVSMTGCALGVIKPPTYVSDKGATFNADIYSNVGGDVDYWWGISSDHGGGATSTRTVTVANGEPKPVSTPFPILDADTTYHLTLCAADHQENPPRTVCSKPTDFRTRPAGGRSGIAFVRSGSIWLMNPDGSNKAAIPNTSSPEAPFFLSWSPDGTKLAFTRDGDIRTIRADGSALETQLTVDGAGTNLEPAWSPDGSKIAFMSYRSGVAQVWVMGADGSHPTQLTHDGNGGAVTQPISWSPDGSKIAYNSYPNGLEQIYVMNADGSNQHNISNSHTYDAQPSWSPDGTKILYVNGVTLWVMNADGSNQHAITSDSDDGLPSWSPDGSQITYTRNRRQIWRANADGTNQTNISNTTDSLSFPAWSPRP